MSGKACIGLPMNRVLKTASRMGCGRPTSIHPFASLIV
jgi:hypothetical protein